MVNLNFKAVSCRAALQYTRGNTVPEKLLMGRDL